MGLFRDNETNRSNETQPWFKIPTGRRKTSYGLFTWVAEDFNSELPRTNAASDQGGK